MLQGNTPKNPQACRYLSWASKLNCKLRGNRINNFRKLSREEVEPPVGQMLRRWRFQSYKSSYQVLSCISAELIRYVQNINNIQLQLRTRQIVSDMRKICTGYDALYFWKIAGSWTFSEIASAKDGPRLKYSWICSRRSIQKQSPLELLKTIEGYLRRRTFLKERLFFRGWVAPSMPPMWLFSSRIVPVAICRKPTTFYAKHKLHSYNVEFCILTNRFAACNRPMRFACWLESSQPSRHFEPD